MKIPKNYNCPNRLFIWYCGAGLKCKKWKQLTLKNKKKITIELASFLIVCDLKLSFHFFFVGVNFFQPTQSSIHFNCQRLSWSSQNASKLLRFWACFKNKWFLWALIIISDATKLHQEIWWCRGVWALYLQTKKKISPELLYILQMEPTRKQTVCPIFDQIQGGIWELQGKKAFQSLCHDVWRTYEWKEQPTMPKPSSQDDQQIRQLGKDHSGHFGRTWRRSGEIYNQNLWRKFQKRFFRVVNSWDPILCDRFKTYRVEGEIRITFWWT